MNCVMYIAQCSWLKMFDLTNSCWAVGYRKRGPEHRRGRTLYGRREERGLNVKCYN